MKNGVIAKLMVNRRMGCTDCAIRDAELIPVPGRIGDQRIHGRLPEFSRRLYFVPNVVKI